MTAPYFDEDFDRWVNEGGAACCPDPDPDQMDPEDIIRSHGYDPRNTPVDTLMAAPFAMHAEVAHAMNIGA